MQNNTIRLFGMIFLFGGMSLFGMDYDDGTFLFESNSKFSSGPQLFLGDTDNEHIYTVSTMDDFYAHDGSDLTAYHFPKYFRFLNNDLSRLVYVIKRSGEEREGFDKKIIIKEYEDNNGEVVKRETKVYCVDTNYGVVMDYSDNNEYAKYWFKRIKYIFRDRDKKMLEILKKNNK